MSSDQYLVVGCRSWSRRVFDETICTMEGRWTFVGSKDEFTEDHVKEVNPRYIFFLHWSWIVPDSIISNYECVCFHMADVPYGRGGSPLQNLILRGHKTTKLTALKMTSEVDAGPVYLKEDLRLDGSAEDIYLRANRLAAQMIQRLIREQPNPVPQEGEPVYFIRRKPEESEIPASDSAEKLYDFIRMLDAEGYPRAFLQHKGCRYEFSKAMFVAGKLTAQVAIIPSEGKSS
jgi:methionyl-tRNA formyltransferase